MKKVLILFPVNTEAERQLFYDIPGEYEYIFCEGEPFANDLEQAEIIIGQPSIRQMRQAKKLKLVQCTFAGVEHYLKHPDFPKHIVLTNSTGAFGSAISEYLLSIILTFYKKMHAYRDQQKQQIWRDLKDERSLIGKQVLIIGAGDIGCSFAKLLSAFSVHTTGIRRVVREVPPYFEAMYSLTELDELLPKADIVAMCLPSTNETRGLMDQRRLRRMKKDALLLNVGRGDAVMTDDLVRVLQSGHLLGAGLDVVDPEPLPKGHPLWQLDNVILTPHISGMSIDHLPQTYRAILDISVENLRRYAQGRKLLNVVDPGTGYREL